MTTAIKTLTSTLHRFLDEARAAGLPPADTGPLRSELEAISAITERMAEEVARVRADGRLSPEGKSASIKTIKDAARQRANERLAAAQQRVENVRSYHATRAKAPRVEGADLMGARSDLDRLLRDAKPGELAGRLRNAVEHGGPDIADLVLGGDYDTRVLLPAAGSEFAADAAQWRSERAKLVRDRVPEAGRANLAALDALPAAEKALTVGSHLLQMAFADDGAPA